MDLARGRELSRVSIGLLATMLMVDLPLQT
jgi:hypothetical protein